MQLASLLFLTAFWRKISWLVGEFYALPVDGIGAAPGFDETSTGATSEFDVIFAIVVPLPGRQHNDRDKSKRGNRTVSRICSGLSFSAS